MNLEFRLLAEDGMARTGVISVNGKALQTPSFIYAATYAQVNLVPPELFSRLGVGAVIANTFQLYQNKRWQDIQTAGGLSPYMRLNGEVTMSDSGGFQVLSYGDAREDGAGKIYPGLEKKNFRPELRQAHIQEDGVRFQLNDGTSFLLTPEKSMEIQAALGADCIFAFDQCHSMKNIAETREIMERSHRWEERSLASYDAQRQALYGIVHGGQYKELREQSARFVSQRPFAGVAIGGFLGHLRPHTDRPKQDTEEILAWTMPHLTPEKPRHLLGFGHLDDIFTGVRYGIDTFDCVSITRLGRHDEFFSRDRERWTPRMTEELKVKTSSHLDAPLDAWCKEKGCPVCTTMTRQQLLTLKQHEPKEKNQYRSLMTQHNIYFIAQLFQDIRTAIHEHRFNILEKEWLG